MKVAGKNLEMNGSGRTFERGVLFMVPAKGGADHDR